MIIGRRAFLRGLVSALAAPAIVRAASLMPIRVMPPVVELDSWQPITELLAQCNDYFLDDDYTNERTGHEFTFQTSLPIGKWRSINNV